MASPINLAFPMGGLNRRYGYQAQPPFTTPDCSNVRPVTGSDRRARGGSRPGLSKIHATQFGTSGSDRPFQFITSVSAIDDQRGILDPFTGSTLGSDWALSTGVSPTVTGGYLDGSGGSYIIRRTPAIPQSTSQTIEIDVATGNSLEYVIHLRASGSGGTFDGLRIKVVFAADYTVSKSFTIDVKEYHAGAETSVSSTGYTDSVTTDSTFKVVTTGSGYAQAAIWWRGAPLETRDGTSSFSGWNAEIGTNTSGATKIYEARIYWNDTSDRVRNLWVCQGNLSVERNGVVRTFLSQYLSDSRWIAHTNYRGNLYTVGSQGLIYNYINDYPTAWTPTAGTVPMANILCTHQDRIWAAEGRIVYACRSGDPLDWQTGADETDEGRAFALTTLEETGDWVTALVPMSRDAILIAKSRALYMVLGDPVAGGQVIPISKRIGILNPHAWCLSPEGILYFMSYDGLYMMPGPNAAPVPLLREINPQLRPDPDTEHATLVYDQYAEGVHIWDVESNNTIADWFFHAPSTSLWPMSFPSSMAMRSIGGAAAVETSATAGSVVWIGCKDGYLRRFDTAATNDDGTTLSSYLEIGPIRLGDALNDGRIDSLDAVLGNGSGAVSWALRSGQDGFSAYSSAVTKASGTWAANRNPKNRPRVGGNAALLRLSSSAIWTIEELVGVRSVTGPTRL